ncbi:hypothetical protein FHG87_012798 [Trinorchestia longiramus]|nr:hypothetical protein FHG87_012798 [Trinorchestia longiramus]
MLRKRSLQQIRAKLESEPQLQYCPPFPRYNENSKERCQDLMSGMAMVKTANKKQEQIQPVLNDTPESDQTILKAKTAQTCQEIKERVTWLREMQQLQAVTEDQACIINAQLATRLRFLQSTT